MVDIPYAGSYAVLKYMPGLRNLCTEDVKLEDIRDSSAWHSLVARYRQMRHSAVMDLLRIEQGMQPVPLMEEEDAGVSDDDPFE